MKLSDAEPPNRLRTGFDCGLAALHATLDVDDRAALASWLNDPAVTDTWVAATLTDVTGTRTDYQMVARHRRGLCVRCRDAGREWL